MSDNEVPPTVVTDSHMSASTTDSADQSTNVDNANNALHKNPLLPQNENAISQQLLQGQEPPSSTRETIVDTEGRSEILPQETITTTSGSQQQQPVATTSGQQPEVGQQASAEPEPEQQSAPTPAPAPAPAPTEAAGVPVDVNQLANVISVSYLAANGLNNQRNRPGGGGFGVNMGIGAPGQVK